MSRPKTHIYKEDKIIFNNVGFPSGFRSLIIGKTGSGKTQLLFDLLLKNLDYDILYICSPSLIYQSEYNILIKSFQANLNKKHIESLFEEQDKIKDIFKFITNLGMSLDNEEKGNIKCITYKDTKEIPLPEKMREKTEKGKKILFIIDDCGSKSQKQISPYFQYGRPLNINTIYLSQNYFLIPRQTIRCNSDVLILFKLNKRDLQNLWIDHASADYKEYSDFEKLAEECWKVKYSFFTINLTETDISKKYNFSSTINEN